MIRLLLTFCVLVTITVMYWYIATSYAAPAKITIEQYGFGSGFWHGCNWLILWISQLFGQSIHIIAANHTTSYMIGFVLGCIMSPLVIKLFLIPFEVVINSEY